MEGARVIGIRGGCPFDGIIDHFSSLGAETVLMEPMMVCGRDQVLSALMHAERAFAEGTNRSKTLLTEIILYASGERQISKAVAMMRPSGEGMVALILGGPDDLELERIGMCRDDTLADASPEKAEAMGLDAQGMSVSLEDLALERVALLDMTK
ncbi:MAG: KEOPS complex subunit Cgi121 [Candidatus Methanomethylophilaceae archaeon]|jgi:KEOPS complex subunit Cgi121|nr:KEOPS complex subunit Cgi121 [Candidatus Methanomethylophilaceae archaeon]